MEQLMDQLRSGKAAQLNDPSLFGTGPPKRPLISNEQLIELLRTHLAISNLTPRISITTPVPTQATQRNLDRELINLLRMQLSTTRATTTTISTTTTAEPNPKRA